MYRKPLFTKCEQIVKLFTSIPTTTYKEVTFDVGICSECKENKDCVLLSSYGTKPDYVLRLFGRITQKSQSIIDDFAGVICEDARDTR